MSEQTPADPKEPPPLALAWRLYREQVVPHDASRVQVMETRRAFYGGAWSFLQALLTHVADPDIPEDDGVKIMETLHAEIQAFEAEVQAGRA